MRFSECVQCQKRVEGNVWEPGQCCNDIPFDQIDEEK